MGSTNCPDCHRPLETAARPHLIPVYADGKRVGTEWGTTVMFVTCPCVIERRRLEDEAAKAQERQDHINRTIRQGGIEPLFATACFEDWKHLPGTEDAYAAALACAERVTAGSPTGLIIMGTNGNGKTTLSVCICKAVAQRFKTFRFQPVAALLQSLRACIGADTDGAEDAIMRSLIACDLLVLDDIGAEKWSTWVDEKLFVIIDGRLTKQRPVVITTNAVKMNRVDTSGTVYLTDLVSTRVYDRLLEMCDVTVNRGESQRRKAMGERGNG